MKMSYAEFMTALENGAFKGTNLQHGTKDVGDDEYIILTHKMIQTGLTDKTLLVYALIYNMCQNTESHKFYGSSNYIATRVNCTIPNALTILKRLTQQGYIVKLDEITEQGVNVYTLPDVELKKTKKKTTTKKKLTKEEEQLKAELEKQGKRFY